jgi:ATP-dependent DNA ligase
MMLPQKAKHLYAEEDKKNPAHLGHDYMIFEKHDGWYGYIDIGSPIMSRQLNVIRSMTDFSAMLNEAFALEMPDLSGRLIFEILVEGSPVFKDLNGILNRHEQAKNAYILVHDFIVEDTCQCFSVRHAIAKLVVGDLNIHEVRMATLLDESSKCSSQWKAIAEIIWARGGEGIVAKKRTAVYSPGKRNADILKIKLEKTEEMLVTGRIKGEGKYEYTLGALVVEDSLGVEHKVSGMADDERDSWWDFPEYIIGKTVEVQFMQRLDNGSLREGRFKAIRYDKTELG